MSYLRFEEAYPSDLETVIAADGVAILPIGTIEWHSHHLPLGLDGIVAGAVAEAVAARLSGSSGAPGVVLLPPAYWAVGGVPYPFTFRFSSDVVQPLLEATFDGLAEMGFRTVIAFTGHFGLAHTLTLKRAALEVMTRGPLTILPFTEYDLVSDRYLGDHAGVGETSLLWHLRPDLVRTDRLSDREPLDGVLGADPRQGGASTAWGAELFDLIVERLSTFAADIAQDMSALTRADYREALAAGVKVLERTEQLRGTQPKSAVPSITTPAYVDHLQSVQRGDFRVARAHAERKLADLQA